MSDPTDTGAIHLGPISGFVMHYATAPNNGGASPRYLCTDAGDALAPSYLNAATVDPAKVSCSRCLEWMHA